MVLDNDYWIGYVQAFSDLLEALSASDPDLAETVRRVVVQIELDRIGETYNDTECNDGPITYA